MTAPPLALRHLHMTLTGSGWPWNHNNDYVVSYHPEGDNNDKIWATNIVV
jgi:hypothetical protein